MITKYKKAFSIILLLLSISVAVPNLALAAPEAGGGGSSTTTTSDATSNCTSAGTCVDCSAGKEGCIDCNASYASCSDPAAKECDNNGCDLIEKIINPLIILLSGIVGLAVVLSIIVGAIQYSSSAGDPQKAAKGRDRIKNAIIALLAYIFLFAFLRFIIPGGLF